MPDDIVIDPHSSIKNRDILYKLIISQLFYDGLEKCAAELSKCVEVGRCPPSEQLLHVMVAGMQSLDTKKLLTSKQPPVALSGIDLEFETEPTTLLKAPEPHTYRTSYVTLHQQACRAGAFSSDGSLVATGSVDASIKILDVQRMIAKTMTRYQVGSSFELTDHPVIRKLYDHIEEVSCLEFHPKQQILASGSREGTIKLFNVAKPSVKKAHKTLTDCQPINSLSFHPTGDYIAIATEHEVLRIYDIETAQCFVGAIPTQQHRKGITCCKYSPTAKLYATGSYDGAIKIWDGVSSRCINTITMAHGGTAICSLQFTRNGKYLLSSGMNSIIYLWELSACRPIQTYTGAGSTGRQMQHAKAIFNHTEDYILFPDEASKTLCSWNARNGCRLKLNSLGHLGAIRSITHSPIESAFLTCSDDSRARFWYKHCDITNLFK